MLTVTEFRAKYPNSTEEQVALYGAAVAAELARGPVTQSAASVVPEPDVPMPMVTVPVPVMTAPAAPSRITTYSTDLIRDWNPPPVTQATASKPPPDLTSDIRRIVLGRRLTARERAQAERPDMTGDDLLALLAGVPNAREWEALEGGD